MEGRISVQPLVAVDVRAHESAPAAGPAVRVTHQPRTARRRQLPGAALVAAAAAAGIAALGLGAWAFVSAARDSDTSTLVREPLVERAVALLANPATERIPLAGSKGRIVLVVSRNDRALLVLNGLGPAPAGKVYEAWLVRPDGRPVRAALFSGRVRIVGLRGRVGRETAVAVTLERAGGAARPSRPPRLLARRATP